LLDRIRGTAVNMAEPGQITQSIGASYVPIDVVKKLCGDLLEKLKIDVEIPGLLFVDTPGHESFVTLRRRGGSVADMAILVIDINGGFQPQTDESLEFLKQFKTPFLVAATKIDRIPGWYSQDNASFSDSFSKQSRDIQDEVEKRLYNLVSQLSERGFEAERFDRIDDFKNQVAIVPTSGKTGEGVPELLVMLSGLAQQFLKERLQVSEQARGSVLEIKEVKGLGTTIDVILYDGSVKRGDYLIVGGKKPIVTRIKALLRPPALRELRMEKKFDSVEEVNAAAGIKISAPDLEGIIAGSPIVCVSDQSKVEEAKKTVQQEVEEVEFLKDIDGVIVKADSLGSLEALIKILKDNDIPIKKAEVGQITKQDVIEADPTKDELKRVILGFNVKPLPEAETIARDAKIKIFLNNIIYKLIEEYKEWSEQSAERKLAEKLAKAIRPCKVRIIPGFVFRKRKPAVFGVEILVGVLKPETPMKKEDGKDIGKAKHLEKEGETVKQAKTGDKVAVSMDEPTVGRQINEGEILLSVITPKNLKALREVWDRLQDDEKELLKEWNLV